MLSLTEMARAAGIMERNPCQWLYSDMTDDGTGPDLLDRFLNLCWGCDEYLNDGLFQPDMDTVLRWHGRNDFRPVPSQAAVVGLLTAWNETRKVLVADQTFNELMNDAERAEGVTERFQSMRAALIWFRQGLERDVRTAELRMWLDAVGWPTSRAVCGFIRRSGVARSGVRCLRCWRPSADPRANWWQSIGHGWHRRPPVSGPCFPEIAVSFEAVWRMAV
ncbi:MAG: hypothetical protein ABF876_16340 [Acetobacter aceti]